MLLACGASGRRRNALRARAGRPVLVAGSTGSVSATAELMRVVSRLDHGAVILPGLDQRLDEESWGLVAMRNRACPRASRIPRPC